MNPAWGLHTGEQRTQPRKGPGYPETGQPGLRLGELWESSLGNDTEGSGKMRKKWGSGNSVDQEAWLEHGKEQVLLGAGPLAIMGGDLGLRQPRPG